MRLQVRFQEEQDLNIRFLPDSTTFAPDFGEIQTIHDMNYNNLFNKPSINGVELVGNKTGEDLDLGSAVFPSGGLLGDLLGMTEGGVGWITPANVVEQDNTRPITAAAVYTEVGNIQALLAII